MLGNLASRKLPNLKKEERLRRAQGLQNDDHILVVAEGGRARLSPRVRAATRQTEKKQQFRRYGRDAKISKRNSEIEWSYSSSTRAGACVGKDREKAAVFAAKLAAQRAAQPAEGLRRRSLTHFARPASDAQSGERTKCAPSETGSSGKGFFTCSTSPAAPVLPPRA